MTNLRKAWPLVAALGWSGAVGCFDESIQSTFTPGADAGGDAGGDAGEASAGGDGACPILTSTLTVFLRDVVNGVDVCDGTVVASSGAGTIDLQVQGAVVACSYTAGFPPPPPGTYTLSVTAPGYEPVTQAGVLITTDSCGNTDAPSVTISLVAQPADAGATDGPVAGG
jgi:hypothetical protein